MGTDRADSPCGETPLEELTRALERVRSACLRLAAATVRDLSLAEEVVQEAFLAAWQHAPDRYDPRRGSLESWVLTLTRHKAVDAVRHAEHLRRVRQLEEAKPHRDHASESPEDLVIRLDDELRLHLHLDRLPVVQQRTLLLMYWHGLTQSEVSMREGTPLGTVKSRTRAAIQRLRDSWPGEASSTGASPEAEIQTTDRSDTSRHPNAGTEGKCPRGAPPPEAEDRLVRQESG